jgi:hypothetical protein
LRLSLDSVDEEYEDEVRRSKANLEPPISLRTSRLI